MSTAEIIISAASIVTPIASLAVAIIVARRNKDKDVQTDAKELGQLQSDIGYIKSGIDDLKKSNAKYEEKLEKYEDKLDKLSEKVTKFESAFKAHIENKGIHNYSRGKRSTVDE